MEGKEPEFDQRGVSELYGTVLIITFALATALALIAGGFLVVDQLSSGSSDSLAQDSMLNVDRVIEDVVSGSVNESGSLSFPEGTGNDVSADTSKGKLTLTVSTNSSDFWDRSLAKHLGNDELGSKEITLGTLRHESDQLGVTAYQGGAVWHRSSEAGETRLRSEPNLDFTGRNLDIGVVSLKGVEAVNEGGTITVRKDANNDASHDLREFMAPYWTDRYNPSITAPVDVNVTITSEYADGWAEYARNGMTKPLEEEDVIYPYKGDENKVKIVFGKIGEEPADTRNPTFGDSDILYSGTADLAHIYYNDTAGEIDGDATAFEVTDPGSDSNYELALYNETGTWLIYNSSTSSWEDGHGHTVDPGDSEAINLSRMPPNGVDGDEFFIDPPAWLSNSAAAPVCVVTDSAGDANVTQYLDEEDEGCLENMVGINEDLVDPIPEVPNFTMQIGAPDYDDALLPDRAVGETVEVEVFVENVGNGHGERPLGVYLIDEANWSASNFGEAHLFSGFKSENFELDAGDDNTSTHSFEAERWMAGEDWVIFATMGQEAIPVGTPSSPETFTVFEPDSNFAVEEITTNAPITEGENMTVDVEVNETVGNITRTETQNLRLTANGTIVAQEEVSLNASELKTVGLSWQTRSGDAGTLQLNASTYDDWNTTTAEVEKSTGPAAEYTVNITSANSPVTAGKAVDVDARVSNVGNKTGDVYLKLQDFNGSIVDVIQIENLGPGNTSARTLTWNTETTDYGNGTVTVAAGEDSDTAPVTLKNPGLTDSNFQVEFQKDSYGVIAGDQLDFSVTVENTGNEQDTQYVYLTDIDGDLVASKPVTLAASASTTISLSWDTSVGDRNSTGRVLVASNDANDTADVTVYEPSADKSHFDVTVTGTNSPVTESEDLNVQATIENTGNSSSSQWVVLENFDGGPVDATEISLSSGQSTTVTFTWETIVGDAGSGNVSVVSADDADSAPAEIQNKTSQVRDPVDVVFVIDETGSMTSNDPDEKRIDATKNAIDSMNSSMDQAAAVGYDYDASCSFWCWGTGYSDGYKWHHRLTGDLNAVKGALSTDPEGSTDIAIGINQAEAELTSSRADPAHNQIMIVLTDGKDNDGQDPVVRAKAVDEDITIYTVGLENAEESVLTEIATEGGSGDGEYYEAENADELSDIFEDIIDEVTAPKTPTFNVSITGTNAPVASGDTLTVDVEVTNSGPVAGEKIISLADHQSTNVDSVSRNLSSGETTTVTLEWDTIGVSAGQKTITANTVDDQDSTQVEIDPPSGNTSNFDIQKVDVVNSPITEGDVLQVNARIINSGSQTDAQEIALWNFGKGKIVGTTNISLDPSEQQDVTLTWNTSVGDAGTGNVTVATANNEQSAPATIDGGSATDSDFQVDIHEGDVADTVVAGDTLTVNATVTNAGTEADTQNVILWDFGRSNLVDIQSSVQLDANESQTITLTWTPELDDVDSGDITVESADHHDNVSVTVAAPNDDVASLLVQDPLAKSDDPVTAGNTLDVTATIENVGNASASDKWVSLSVVDQDSGKTVAQDYVKIQSLSAGSTRNVTLQWATDEGVSGDFDLIVETESDDETATVTVQSGLTDFDINIANTNSPISAGEELMVVAEVTNNGGSADTAIVELLDKSTGIVTAREFDVDVDPGETEVVQLTWMTRVGDGSDTPKTVRAEIANTNRFDEQSVTIDKVTNSVQSPSMDPGGSPIDINLEEIEMGS